MSAVRVPPIPRALRGEAVTVRRQAEGDYGGTFGEPVEVPRCRVERQGALAVTEYQLTPGCSARVFVDATEYAGDIREGDLVGFDGEDHAVASVARYDQPDGSPHHWEADVR